MAENANIDTEIKVLELRHPNWGEILLETSE
jgi:hypothetical protein